MYDMVVSKALINDSFVDNSLFDDFIFELFHLFLGFKQIVIAISSTLIRNSYLFLWTLFYLRAFSSIALSIN